MEQKFLFYKSTQKILQQNRLIGKGDPLCLQLEFCLFNLDLGRDL